MPTIKRFSNVTLYIFGNDHVPPHFHLRGPNTQCQVHIETLQVIRGRYDRRDYAEAVAWAADNQALLCSVWSDLNE
jgi:hypothetical protein